MDLKDYRDFVIATRQASKVLALSVLSATIIPQPTEQDKK